MMPFLGNSIHISCVITGRIARHSLLHGPVSSSLLQDRSRGTDCQLLSRQPVDRSAADRLQSGPADVQSPQQLDAVVPSTPNPGSRTRPQPAIDHYGAVSTFHSDNICETRFSMLCTGSLELTAENSYQ